MQIILSANCLSLVGTLQNGCGFHLECRKQKFYAVRNASGYIPPDGHWRFIILCAELVRDRLFIKDIRVSGYELKAALTEAAFLASANRVNADYEYSAAEILDLKTLLAL